MDGKEPMDNNEKYVQERQTQKPEKERRNKQRTQLIKSINIVNNPKT